MATTSHGVGGLTFDSKKRALPPEAGVFLALILITVGLRGAEPPERRQLPFQHERQGRRAVQQAAARHHSPAGRDHRDHRDRRHPGHHHRRHRPLLRLGRRRDGHDRDEFRPDRDRERQPEPEGDLRRLGDGPAGDRTDRGRARLRPLRGPGERAPDRLHEDPAVHRHARHDGVGARRGALVVERQPGLVPDRRLRPPRERRRGRHADLRARALARPEPGDRLLRARDPVPPDHALHALRQALLRDRLERGRGADVGDQRRPPQGAGLHDRQHAGRGGGDPPDLEEPDRAGGHGRDVRARRHRHGGDRRRVARRRPRLDRRHGDRGADLQRDHLGLHLDPARRLLPGHGEGRDHRRRRGARPMAAAPRRDRG